MRLDPGIDERLGFADRLLQRTMVHLCLVHVAQAEPEQDDRERRREGVSAKETETTGAIGHISSSSRRHTHSSAGAPGPAE